MSIMEGTIEISCDNCQMWETSSFTSIQAARHQFARSGWKYRKNDNGLMDDICPCCLGKQDDYWQSYNSGKRIVP